jgi:hypothetical protein
MEWKKTNSRHTNPLLAPRSRPAAVPQHHAALVSTSSTDRAARFGRRTLPAYGPGSKVHVTAVRAIPVSFSPLHLLLPELIILWIE